MVYSIVCFPFWTIPEKGVSIKIPKSLIRNIRVYIYIWYIINIFIYIHIYIHIYIGSRLGVPRSFQEPSVLSLYYKRRYGIEMGGGGVGGGVTTSCGVRWIQSCGNLEDVASLTMLLRCKYRCCSRSKQLLQKALVDVKMKKVWCSFRPWFSSELWHFLVINKTTNG